MSNPLTADQVSQLLHTALSARHLAHAPYSNFLVGAAALTADGSLFTGVNVENASYGLTCCAERVALFSAIAAGHRTVVALAVATDGGHAPCGACRQVISELAGKGMIFLVDASRPDTYRTCSVDELLPWRFDSAALEMARRNRGADTD